MSGNVLTRVEVLHDNGAVIFMRVEEDLWDWALHEPKTYMYEIVAYIRMYDIYGQIVTHPHPYCNRNDTPLVAFRGSMFASFTGARHMAILKFDEAMDRIKAGMT